MENTITDYMLCGMIEKLVKDEPELLDCFYKVSEIDQSFSIGYHKEEERLTPNEEACLLYCERAEQETLDAAGQQELEEFCMHEAQKQEEVCLVILLFYTNSRIFHSPAVIFYKISGLPLS